jgi:hypothetical protein
VSSLRHAGARRTASLTLAEADGDLHRLGNPAIETSVACLHCCASLELGSAAMTHPVTEHPRKSLTPTLRRRPDIAPNLMHLLRGHSRGDAFAALHAVIAGRCLSGSDRCIEDGSRCVSFIEAPIRQLRNVFHWSAEHDAHRQPYGVLLGKDYLFALGGRPVIYQPESEYALLPEALRFRHVRYDPLTVPPIDVSWEREWRLRADVLQLEPERCCIVVASEADRAALFTEHAEREEVRLEALGSAVGGSLADQFAESFPWPVISLDA